MNVLYIDAFSGVSGDKFVGSLLSLFDHKEELLKNLKTLKIKDEFEIEVLQKKIMGINCHKFNVLCKFNHSESNIYEHTDNHHDHHKDEKHTHRHKEDSHTEKHSHNGSAHHHRGLSEIINIINESDIAPNAKKMSIDLFGIIGEAESKVHNVSIEEIHFHEVGAIDSIVDIVSAAVLMDMIKPDKVISSPIPLGSGFVNTMHGRLPVPAPATTFILTHVPVYQGEVKSELTTPTGAAIIKYFADEFSEINNFKIQKTGYGAGTKEFEIPNFLRIFYGSDFVEKIESDVVTQLETNIDDASPEEIGFLFNKLMDNKALDVYITPVYMKKNRPGHLISVICRKNDVLNLEDIIFNNSSTFGIRKINFQRSILKREIKEINVMGEIVKVKLGYYKNKLIKTALEYESVKEVSDKLKMSYNKFVKTAEFEMIKTFKIE